MKLKGKNSLESSKREHDEMTYSLNEQVIKMNEKLIANIEEDINETPDNPKLLKLLEKAKKALNGCLKDREKFKKRLEK